MDDADPSRPVYRFAPFEFDPRSGELRRHGVAVRLQEQPFQILKLLLARPGEVVTRDEARRTLWPGDTFVDFDVGLNSAIKRLRDALHDSADAPRFVETLPRRGYRFIAALDPPPAPIPEVLPPPRAAALPGRRRARWAIALAAMAAVLVAGIAWNRRGIASHDRMAPAPIRSLVVLPFQNLTGDPEQQYFVDGVTEAVTTNLAQISALKVISRTSAMQFRKPEKSLPQIAAELGVDAVVEGAVTRGAGQVRVTAQLIHAATDQHLWARSYDRDAGDVLALEAEVATAIAAAVGVEVHPDERRRLSRATAVRSDAYESYLKGRFYWAARGKDNVLTAAGYFQRAVEQDPTFAAAYSGLSDSYRLFETAQGVPPRECMPRAEAAARKALSLDDSLAEAHASLATVLFRYEWDWRGAEREYLRALALDPNYAEGHRSYAIYLLTMRRGDEALAHAERARELSPLSAIMAVEAAFAAARMGRFDQAASDLQKARDVEPGFPRIDQTQALIYLQQGDVTRAVALFDAKRAARPADAPAAPGPWKGYVYGVSGRTADARAVLASIEERARRQYVSPQALAIVHLGLGDRSQALTLLDQAFEERAIDVLGFSGPLFDILHDEPRYRALAARMGLADAYW